MPVDAKALIEARARVMWGDPKSDVEAYLVEHGATPAAAAALVAAYHSDRIRFIRGLGLSQIRAGATTCFLAIMGAWFLISFADLDARFRFARELLMVAIITAGFGAWRTVGGVLKWALPQDSKGDVSALDDE